MLYFYPLIARDNGVSCASKEKIKKIADNAMPTAQCFPLLSIFGKISGQICIKA